MKRRARTPLAAVAYQREVREALAASAVLCQHLDAAGAMPWTAGVALAPKRPHLVASFRTAEARALAREAIAAHDALRSLVVGEEKEAGFFVLTLSPPPPPKPPKPKPR